MTVGIDATNIRAGGGLTHLLEVIKHASLAEIDVNKVIIWGGSQLDMFPTAPWLELRKVEALNGSVFKRLLWIVLWSKKEFVSSCDILWSPGGTFYSSRMPYVSMSQNMLVFEKEERNRFPMSITKIRYDLLNFFQSRSFRHAKGIIFLTTYARDVVKKQVRLHSIDSVIIPHGVSTRFRHAPKEQRPISSYTSANPFRILYVSIVNFYKHQWNLIEAVKVLRQQYAVELVLVGPMYAPCAERFHASIRGHESYIIYKGAIDYSLLSEEYVAADLFAYCSTCENMPNILIEAMASSLPILSSSYGPMPEVLQDGGVYCDPLNVKDILINLNKLVEQPELRKQLAQNASALSHKYSWANCAKQTFEFIDLCYKKNRDRVQ